MKLLVIGGTVFVGRHIVEAALARGHQVALFNRGRSGAWLFPEVERIAGDRDGDHAALRGRVFDAVLDTSGYRPAQVNAASRALSPETFYVFISSVSAYRSFAPGKKYDENAPLAPGDSGYGPLKARCEEALEAERPGRVAHVRPGLVVGPHDPTGRFTYWPRRLARGGAVLAPGRPQRPVQFIDARDLASWCVSLAEGRTAGRFNALGPSLSMGELLEACSVLAPAGTSLRWLSDERLLAAGVAPWTELPLWIPEADAEAGGMMLADNGAALKAGLRARPVADTVRDTFEWDAREGASGDASRRVATLTAERESELLGRQE